MDKVTKYKTIIEEALSHQASIKISNLPAIEQQLIIDESGGQFLLLNVGWQNKRYIHGLVIHIQIKNDKVWIHEDMTDIDIAGKLIEQGIPKSDIVLGFVAPYARGIEGFAAA
ncbi:MAG: XisI protein [Lewinellaceae bacterium]|nr:XisI protein [Lewinellaceae bacterium]